jgi:1-aminocyclopropane-1-carboxylate deaminase/D-cysteine desulfhydrase-like pyridoxal-dependent ACC family enzyme
VAADPAMSTTSPAALGCWPTPLHHVPDHPDLVLEREDLNGLGFGGNKVRALEAIADVVRSEASEVAVHDARVVAVSVQKPEEGA